MTNPYAGLSESSQFTLARYHRRRNEQLHRALCPFLLVALALVIRWALQLIAQ